MTDGLAQDAVRNCAMLYRLVIRAKDCSIMDVTYTLEEHGHNIRELEFQHNIDICHLLQMPTILGQLTSLTFTEDLIYHKQDWQTFGNLCSNLLHLNIRDLKKKEDLDVLLFSLKDSLVSLKLGNLPNERCGESQIDVSPFIHCTLLERLSLGGGGNAIDFKAIGRLGSLKELSITTAMDLISDEDFEEAFKQQEMMSLQTLDLRYCSTFGKKAMLALMKCCPNLKKVSCEGLHQIEELVKALKCGPTKLHKLHLSWCELNRNAIMSVASLSDLRELHLDAWGEDLMSHDYTDAFDQGNLVNLEVLSLSNFRHLQSEGLKALMKGSSMLKCVKLMFMPSVDDYADIFVECNLEHLETFHAISCPGFQNHDISVLKKSCPRIRDIVPKAVDVVSVSDYSSDSYDSNYNDDYYDYDTDSDNCRFRDDFYENGLFVNHHDGYDYDNQ
jgi:hypothetical protein